MDQDDIIDLLNGLIRVSEDSHMGYQRAAEDAAEAGLKELLNDMAARRAAMVRDLQRLVAASGGAPEATGTLLGGAQRMLSELKATLGARPARAIVDDMTRIDSETRRHFTEALDREGLPEALRRDLEGHADRIRGDCDRLASHAPEEA